MTTRVCRVAVVVGVCLAGWVGGAVADPLGTEFTYQGQLRQSGVASSGLCDFQFSLWNLLGSGDPPTGGTQRGATQYESSVSVTGGLFTVVLHPGGVFGANPFAGDERWLQIGVRCPSARSPFSVPGFPLSIAPKEVRHENRIPSGGRDLGGELAGRRGARPDYSGHGVQLSGPSQECWGTA